MNASFFRIGLRAGLAAMLVLSIGLLSGCGKGNKAKNQTANIEGKVMYDGEVLKAGTIILLTTDENKNTQLTIPINRTGNFQVGGIPPGEYYVGVETDSAFQERERQEMRKQVSKRGNEIVLLEVKKIPQKYNDPKFSGLKKITIAANQKTPIIIEIPKE